MRVIELRNYTGDVMASLQPTLRKAGHRLEIGDGEPIKLETAPSALWQIISNLVMNSMLHAFDPDQHGVLRLDIDRVGDTAILTYRDNGKGMPAEIRHRIFEPFFTTKRGQGGSGLGLSIVYNLATQTLGGTIACETKPGAGTEFVIAIPIRGRKSGARTSAA
ncbi:MAG: hypothetical protein QOJ54_3272 [Aliidongia sp.]|nr:hypothetical protein [Aliidongia sp.]